MSDAADRLDFIERGAGTPRRARVLECWGCGRLVYGPGGNADLERAYDDGCRECDTRSLQAAGVIDLPLWGQA